jgi:hypothetical protein
MKRLIRRIAPLVLASGVLAVALSGCVVAGDGYGSGYDANVGMGADYFEPYGTVYGGWESGYRVGPYRDGNHRWQGGGGTHAYRGAGAARAMPSLPSRSRGVR